MYTFEVIFINDGGERVTRTVDARHEFEAVRVHSVMSYTNARRAGMRDERYGDDWSNVYNDVPANWNELLDNER